MPTAEQLAAIARNQRVGDPTPGFRLMGMSERDARGPEEHEHLFLIGDASCSAATASKTRRWSGAPPARRLLRSETHNLSARLIVAASRCPASCSTGILLGGSPRRLHSLRQALLPESLALRTLLRCQPWPRAGRSIRADACIAARSNRGRPRTSRRRSFLHTIGAAAAVIGGYRRINHQGECRSDDQALQREHHMPFGWGLA